MRAIDALRRFDVADQFECDDETTAYLNVYLEDEDAAMFIHGLGTVARARAKKGIAPSAGVSHDTLYKALCEKSIPRLDTVTRVMKSLGLRLAVEHVGTAGDFSQSADTLAVP